MITSFTKSLHKHNMDHIEGNSSMYFNLIFIIIACRLKIYIKCYCNYYVIKTKTERRKNERKLHNMYPCRVYGKGKVSNLIKKKTHKHPH